LLHCKPPEQLDDNATTDTTTPPGAAGGGGQEQRIHITKDGTNSYVLSGGSSRVGSFDTTYIVVGERGAIRTAENLIISTITEDFRSSPTIGYVRGKEVAAQLVQLLLFPAHLQAMSR
jgi:hypothetical protein